MSERTSGPTGRLIRAASFDHLVGAGEQRRSNDEAERHRSLEIDYQLGPGDLLDRQVGGLLTRDNPAGVDASLTVRLCNTAPQPQPVNITVQWY